MCGIVGYIGPKAAGPILLEGLQRLEYRGYDSAGLAIITQEGQLAVKKTVGKLGALISALNGSPPPGCIGMGHTRWATHGKPSTVNAHPHVDCRNQVVVIHNGIVENYLALKKSLISEGHIFVSQTDTEVIPHLIEARLAQGADLETSVREVAGQLEGSHAIIVLGLKEPQKMVAVRIGNAGGLVVGYGEGEMYVASDLPAILPYTRTMAFLASHEVAVLTPTSVRYTTLDGTPLKKSPQQVPYDPVSAAKGGYKHFILKEIMEQPQTVMDAFRGRVSFEPADVMLEDFALSPQEINQLRRVIFVGMGTSLHAAMVGRLMMERLAQIPSEVENASEFRYRNPILDPHTLVVAVGQSGETVDTLAAMDEAKRKGAPLAAVCNVVGSQATRVAHSVVYIRAGLEIGVASTKTFTGSLVCLYLLAAYFGQVRGVIGPEQTQKLVNQLVRLPNLIGGLLGQAPYYERLAHQYFRLGNFLYLGRGLHYPIALEGALKLKELSYIHAEGYPAGEMKHGPIALIDENMPVVAIAVRDALYDKMESNVEQVKARDGIVLALVTEGDRALEGKVDHLLPIPATSDLLYPVLTAVPLQLLAYHIARRRGCDVDQPRNLAKSVTVE